MLSGEWFGLIAGAITTLGFLPQVIRVYKLKSAWEISLTFAILFIIGLGCWLAYGIFLRLLPGNPVERDFPGSCPCPFICQAKVSQLRKISLMLRSGWHFDSA